MGEVALKLLQKINKKLTDKVPLVEHDVKLFAHPKGVSTWTATMNGNYYNRLIIYLRSDVGCNHGINTGGCSGCKHWRLGTAGKKLNIPDMYINQYLSAVKSHGLREIVSLYNEGNILNTDELPAEQLLFIVKHMADNGVKKLIIESRPEFIAQDILDKIKNTAGNMVIEVGIGLESSNNFIRNEIFLKNMTLEDYESAISKLNSYGMNTLTYVLLKPAFLNEAQAIQEAVNTIRYALNAGSKAVSLEPIGIEPYTLTQVLYDTNDYVPPKLWSILEVVKQTYKLGEVRIGSCQIEPRPTHLPQNCKSCTDVVLKHFEIWNQTYNISILDKLDCGVCRKNYVSQIKHLDSTICEEIITNRISVFANYCYKNAIV